MGLQLLLGGSGFGKSQVMYAQVVRESLAHPEKNYFIVVPEQYTMQVQKKIVQMHPDHCTMTIDVVSFGRLAYRIFAELGMDTLTVLDDIGKGMVVRRIVNRELSKLKVFRGNAGKSGFIGEMKSTISELLQYRISPDDLGTAIEQLSDRPALRGKLEDIRCIYGGFMDYISQKYMTTEEILDKLVQVIGQSELVRRSAFYLDEFTGFTPPQYALIGELLRLSPAMQIALTVDTREDIYRPAKPFELFHLTRDTIHRLNRLCQRLHIERGEDIILPHAVRFPDGSPLSVLERHIYRSGGTAEQGGTGTAKQGTANASAKIDAADGSRSTSAVPCAGAEATSVGGGGSDGEPQVSIYAARNPYEELAFVSQEILRLCRSGLRYRDFAIVTGDLASYGHVAEQAMREAGIPIFIDAKKDVLSNSFVDFIRALIDVAAEDFSYDAVFRCLKTGWTDIACDDLDRLDNYVLATGVRGFGMWSKPFVRIYRGVSKNELVSINQIREQAMSWLAPVREVFHEQPKTAAQFSRALSDYLTEKDMETRVEARSRWFEAQGELGLAREYQQIYQVVTDIFERMAEIIGDEPMNVRTYRDILDAGLNEAKVGIIPPGIDQVMIGDILRTRLDDVKVLFFVGVNDGIVPGTVRDGGLINDRDKEALAACDFELAPTGKQDLYTEHFYIYSMLAKPSHRLIISFSKNDSGGRAMRPSSLIERISALLPQVRTQDLERVADASGHIYSVKAAESYLTEGMRKAAEADGHAPVRLPKQWFDLYVWMSRQGRRPAEKRMAAAPADEGQTFLSRLMDMAFAVHEDTPLSKAAVRALYGRVLMGSVTMLEQYASCAYAHFLSYGLGLKERQEFHLSAPDLGTLFHRALELFSRRLSDSEYNWHTVPEDVRDSMADACVEAAASEERHLILTDNFRNRSLLERLRRVVQKTVWALQMQIRRGSFEPANYEMRFDGSDGRSSLRFELPGHEAIQLVGVIDRLDLCEDEDQLYVRIIDYKSGTTKFDMSALFYGLQLQLIVYMEAAMDQKSRQAGGKKVTPAGILYYNISDPFIAVDSASMCGGGSPLREDAAEGAVLTQPVDSAAAAADDMTDHTAGGTAAEPVGGPEDDAALTENEIAHETLKALKMNGLVNSSERIIHAMDAHVTGASDILPVTFNTDGSLSRSSSVASTEHFQQLFAFTADKVKALGQDILNGEIGVHPYDRGSRGNACNYCPYQAVCGFDEDIEGFEVNRIREMSRDEVWQQIGGGEVRHGHDMDRGTEEGH